MITKTTPKEWMLSLLSAIFLLSGLTACSSTEDSAEDSAKHKPEVPINDDDWQTVPATGGTITKDSLSIIFPNGTFAEDAKVAITEVKKGEIGGKYEASKFYQITMPCTTNKPIALNIKSSEKGDDIAFIVRSGGYAISSGQYSQIETRLDYTSNAGEYTAELPVFDNGENADNLSLIFGIAHLPQLGQSSTRGNNEWEGQVGNIKWKLNIPLGTWLVINDTTYRKIESVLFPKVYEYVKTALTKIQELGFKTKEERNNKKNKVRTINVNFETKSIWDSDELYGWHNQSDCSDEWSSISIGVEKNTGPDADDLNLKCTVIHELFHYYQSEYDSRSPMDKADKIGTLFGRSAYEYLVMYEMGGPWAEQFVNEGQLNSKWLLENALSYIFTDRAGLTNIKERWDLNGVQAINKRYQNQGYSMSPLLYYLCSSADMKIYGFSNKSVVELHELWDKYTMEDATLYIIDQWVNSHDFRGGLLPL